MPAKYVTPDKWKWFGHAGHLIVAQWCRYHLCTQVGKYLISTVGEYWPERSSREINAGIHDPKWLAENKHRKGDDFDHAYMKRFGYETIGCDRKYETYVFEAGHPCDAEGCGCGLPSINGSEIDGIGANDAKAAHANHMKLCKKWSEEAHRASPNFNRGGRPMTDAQKEKRMMVSYPGLPSDEPHEESPDCRGQGCIPLELLKGCRNPNHALTDGTPSTHEIGPSCMAESSPVAEQGKAGVAEGTQQEAPPLTYEQEVHALLWSAKSNTESLIQYFYAQAKIERGEMARITRKCIENAQETVRRLEAIIPQALERRELASRALPERKEGIGEKE